LLEHQVEEYKELFKVEGWEVFTLVDDWDRIRATLRR